MNATSTSFHPSIARMALNGQQLPFAFGDWQVDPSRGLLTKPGGENVRLEPRLMDLLLLFAGSAGHQADGDHSARPCRRWAGTVTHL
jgi:hypothetical protein